MLDFEKFKSRVRKNVSKTLYKLCVSRRKNRTLLESYHNKYVGRRAFIVCNGPSLKASDLDKLALHGEISFASNKINKIYSQTNWRPTFYTVSDESYQFSLLESMNDTPSECQFYRDWSFLTTRKVKHKKVFLNMRSERELLDNPQFAENCTDYIYGIATVTYVMLQLAVHMGIREIYIIGCDNSYGITQLRDGTIVKTSNASYFAGTDSKDSQIVGSTWEMNIAYEYARKYADENGIKIYNATRGGFLEVFDRKDFDSLFVD